LKAEQAAGKHQYATWSTRRAGGFLFNLGGGDVLSQAGITVYPIHGKLIARDEVRPSYKVDQETLIKRGVIPITGDNSRVGYKAHSKLAPHTGECIVIG
jgi:carotenoid cleavage dioxygenase-like enzyme